MGQPTAAYPIVIQGKPVNITPRSHSNTVHAAGASRQTRTASGAGMRAWSQPALAGKSARKAQKDAVANTASGAGMPPNSLMLTYTHETPAPKKPSPNQNPAMKQRRGDASLHCWTSSAKL